MVFRSVSLAITAAALLALSGCGPSSEPAALAAAPAPVVAENALGKGVYGKVCSMCHASGAAGAPKPGNTDEWGPRIAKGTDTLVKNAIEGFNGETGVMPPRGGATSLTDDEVKAAVEYMVAQAR